MKLLILLGWILGIYLGGAFASYLLMFFGNEYLEDQKPKIQTWDDFDDILMILALSWLGFFVLAVFIIKELYQQYKKNNKPPKLF